MSFSCKGLGRYSVFYVRVCHYSIDQEIRAAIPLQTCLNLYIRTTIVLVCVDEWSGRL